MKNLEVLGLAFLIGATPITSSFAIGETNNEIEKKITEDIVSYKFGKNETLEKSIEKAINDYYKEEKAKEVASKKTSVLHSMSVPQGNSSFKSYMDYKAITNTKSAQYKVNRASNVYTDSCGMRRVVVGQSANEDIDDFVVALGTFYGKVGDRFSIQFSNGQTITAVMGDLKANKHTDSTNRYHLKDKSVVEFIVENNRLNKLVKQMGDVSYLTYGLNPNFKINGNVVKIDKLTESI